VLIADVRIGSRFILLIMAFTFYSLLMQMFERGKQTPKFGMKVSSIIKYFR